AASPRTAGIPVVLETSAEDFPSYQRARRHGIAAFVSKPFRLAEVVETCRRILEGARPLQGRAEATETTPPAPLRHEANVPVVRGWLVEGDERGARVDRETPREVGRRVRLATQDSDAEARRAEVRWVSPVAGRYHHGLAFLSD